MDVAPALGAHVEDAAVSGPRREQAPIGAEVTGEALDAVESPRFGSVPEVRGGVLHVVRDEQAPGALRRDLHALREPDGVGGRGDGVASSVAPARAEVAELADVVAGTRGLDVDDVVGVEAVLLARADDGTAVGVPDDRHGRARAGPVRAVHLVAARR